MIDSAAPIRDPGPVPAGGAELQRQRARPAKGFTGNLAVGALAALCLIGTPRHAPAAVFGDDDRAAVPPARKALAERIGLISSPDGKHACTAFCVSPGVIATAAHCLMPAANRSVATPADLTFRVGAPDAPRQSRIATADLVGTDAAQVVGARTLHLKPPINATDDWAFARLANPVCSSGGLPLSQRTPDQIIDAALDGRVSLAAFHRDRDLVHLAFQAGCEIDTSFSDRGADAATLKRDFADLSALLLHRCDTGLGSSGAPLIIDGIAGPEIAGLNIGTYLLSRTASVSGTDQIRKASEAVANTAVGAAALADHLAAFAGRETLRKGDEIARLQRRLGDIGLYSGADDGEETPALRLAIVAYERAHALPPTGVATLALLYRLAESAALGMSGTVANQRVTETGSTK